MYPLHSKFRNNPVWKATLIQYLNLNVAIILRHCVTWPVPITFLPTFLYTSGEHHDGSGVGLPTHSPKVITCRRKWPLRDDELPRRIETLKR